MFVSAPFLFHYSFPSHFILILSFSLSFSSFPIATVIPIPYFHPILVHHLRQFCLNLFLWFLALFLFFLQFFLFLLTLVFHLWPFSRYSQTYFQSYLHVMEGSGSRRCSTVCLSCPGWRQMAPCQLYFTRHFKSGSSGAGRDTCAHACLGPNTHGRDLRWVIEKGRWKRCCFLTLFRDLNSVERSYMLPLLHKTNWRRKMLLGVISSTELYKRSYMLSLLRKTKPAKRQGKMISLRYLTNRESIKDVFKCYFEFLKP